MATNSEALKVKAQNAGILEPVSRLRRNVCFGMLDYMVQPFLMLVTARFFVRHLGVPQFGMWMLVLAVIGSSGTLCTGFGDAALKYVSMMRGRLDQRGVREVVSASFTLNLFFGAVVGSILFILAPWVSSHLFHLSLGNGSSFALALRIGAGILIVRSVSFVFISVLRGFEHYNAATQVTSLTRLAIIVAALLLSFRGYGLVAIVVATAICEATALCALIIANRIILGASLRVSWFRWESCRQLLHFGTFSWLQALSGTMFSQGDRLIVGALLGPAALTYYSVCVQAAQPIHGLAASASNVLFPHLSARVERETRDQLAPTVLRSILLNTLFVGLLTLPLVIFGGPILHAWMGAAFADHATGTLRLVALSFAFLALNIPGHYALLALGNVRYLTALNVAGGVGSLAIAWILIPHLGIVGAAIGRLAYGPLTWLLYLKLAAMFATTLKSSLVVQEAPLESADLV